MTPDQQDFSPPEPSIEDLFSPGPAASPQEIQHAVAASMGLGSSPAPRPRSTRACTSWRKG
jgi:hypothetical protein